MSELSPGDVFVLPPHGPVRIVAPSDEPGWLLFETLGSRPRKGRIEAQGPHPRRRSIVGAAQARRLLDLMRTSRPPDLPRASDRAFHLMCAMGHGEPERLATEIARVLQAPFRPVRMEASLFSDAENALLNELALALSTTAETLRADLRGASTAFADGTPTRPAEARPAPPEGPMLEGATLQGSFELIGNTAVIGDAPFVRPEWDGDVVEEGVTRNLHLSAHAGRWFAWVVGQREGVLFVHADRVEEVRLAGIAASVSRSTNRGRVTIEAGQIGVVPESLRTDPDFADEVRYRMGTRFPSGHGAIVPVASDGLVTVWSDGSPVTVLYAAG